MGTKLLIGLYSSEDALLGATREAREKGYAIHDAYTPYAVHGLDQAMGLRPTRLGWVCFGLGSAGLTLALFFQSWTFVSDWPLNVGGKDPWALPALLPVTFEVTVLFAAIGTVLALFLRTGLLPGKRPKVSVPETSDDRFALALVVPESAGDPVRAHLAAHHPVEIREIEA